MNTPIYEILKSIMDERELSIAETARICNLPDSTVRGIITRKQKSIALEVAFKLSNGLGVSLEYLNGDNKKSPVPKHETEPVTEEQVEKILIQFGFIKPGEDLSTADLHFLMSIGNLIQSWFEKRK